MEYYDLDFEEQIEELDMMWRKLEDLMTEIETDNPFYEDLIDLTVRIAKEKEKTEKRKPKDNTNEYLKAEYYRNQL